MAKKTAPAPCPYANSIHMGEVDGTYIINLTVVRTDHWYDEWGVGVIYNMVDKAGNLFTWRTTGKGMLPGRKFKLKVTVKGHEISNDGYMETQLTRCFIVKSYPKV